MDLNGLGDSGVLFFFVHTCCVLMSSMERHRGERLVRSFLSVGRSGFIR